MVSVSACSTLVLTYQLPTALPRAGNSASLGLIFLALASWLVTSKKYSRRSPLSKDKSVPASLVDRPYLPTSTSTVRSGSTGKFFRR